MKGVSRAGNFSPNSGFGGSYQSQLDLNDVPDFANEPGPGHYFTNYSCFGKQDLSKSISAPEIGFAKTGWDGWSKVMITKAHEDAFRCRESPGHAYHRRDGGLSKKTTKIGSSLRPDMSTTLGVDPHGSPGPGINLRDVPRAEDRMHAPMDAAFGKSNRFGKDGVNDLGPGQYSPKATGVRGNTGKSFSVGRSAYNKVIRPGWETEGQCTTSPGVGPPLWSNINKDGSRANSIGRAERFPKSASSCSPGPGAYNRDERDVSRQSGSICSDTRSPSSFKFGRHPTKPRFRQLLASTTAKRGAWGYL